MFSLKLTMRNHADDTKRGGTEIVDRPPVWIQLIREDAVPVPQKTYASHRDRWLDIDFRAEQMALELENYEYYADSLPIVWPNLGPGSSAVGAAAGMSSARIRRGVSLHR